MDVKKDWTCGWKSEANDVGYIEDLPVEIQVEHGWPWTEM